MSDPNAIPNAAHHRRTALAVLGMVAVMLGLAYAAVPLYRVFCRATGYGGTPQVAAAGAASRGARTLNVRFDATWRRTALALRAETPEMAVRDRADRHGVLQGAQHGGARHRRQRAIQHHA